MKYTLFDIETNGLLEVTDKIHCLAYEILEDSQIIEKGSITDPAQIAFFILQQEILVGHNIILFDIPVLEKLLNIKIKARLIDTLPLSWYLYPQYMRHGLEALGEIFKVPKPVIKDWNNLTPAEYIHRCEQDVIINRKVFLAQYAYLFLLYDGKIDRINNFINYLTFKLDCIREQEVLKCKIDLPLVEKSLKILEAIVKEKESNLIAAMPLHVTYKKVTKPAKMLKKDSTLSAQGAKWYKLLEEQGLSLDYNEEIIVKSKEEPGNPSSSKQIKDWLFSLGWEPRTFAYRMDETKENIKKIPQIYSDNEVCSSIKDLYSVEPALENLDMLSLVNHRIGIFKGFKENVNEQGFIAAGISGLAPSLRFKHKRIVNLPKPFKFFGKEIRASIIAPDNAHELLGTDLASAEATCQHNAMYKYDPEYVKEKMAPGFDPHLDLAKVSGLLTPEEATQHILYDKTKGAEGTDYTEVRFMAKQAGFSFLYGAGPPKVTLVTGIPIETTTALHKAYWKKNWSVKQIARDALIKVVNKQKWLYNPVSGFWVVLRTEKDIFSVLNQSTAVFIFDLYLREARKRGLKAALQMHDEFLAPVLKGKREETTIILNESIQTVNKIVNLAIPFGVSIAYGDNYSVVH